MIETNSDDTALLVIDVQNDFCPGGALAVAEGNVIVSRVNRMMGQFKNVVLTQDWHPVDHVSFASNQVGGVPFGSIDLNYGMQTLWPNHCVQGTAGAEFHPDLHLSAAQMVVRKGFRSGVDSYSAFFENDQVTPTGLDGYLKDRGISRVVLCGIATDYCVAWSALNAVRLGYETTVVLSACAAIDLEGSLALQLKAMEEVGINLVEALGS